MSLVLSMILTASLLALVAGVTLLEYIRKGQRRLVASVILIAVAAGVFIFVRAGTIETKGPGEESIAVAFCYLAMLLGMVAEYGYAQAERGENRFKFDLQFFMPIFASPIVFIPLLTITTDMSIGGAFTKAKLMVYLVAFQNGFFWKSFFEQRRQKAIEGALTIPADVAESLQEKRSRAAVAK